MPDYAEMQRALRAGQDRVGGLGGATCPLPSCDGLLRRADAHDVVCTRCGRRGVDHTGR